MATTMHRCIACLAASGHATALDLVATASKQHPNGSCAMLLLLKPFSCSTKLSHYDTEQP